MSRVDVHLVKLSVLFEENLNFLGFDLLLGLSNSVKALVRLLVHALLLLDDDVDVDCVGRASMRDVPLEESSFAILHELCLLHLDLSDLLLVDLITKLTSLEG
jgi:hypothetical protein